ncbi:hypothetical protein BGX26_002156 [Mortierella sp. AD094]|nr:hypothetical protein BGX26_002156 [Mortierella sp. AD094]
MAIDYFYTEHGFEQSDALSPDALNGLPKVIGVDRDNIYLPLRKLQSSLTSHNDPTVSFLAEYASQGLEFIGDDEPVQMTIFRYGKLAFALAKDAKDIAINMDISAFVSAYDNLSKICDYPKNIFGTKD